MKKHEEEANSTSASMKGACEAHRSGLCFFCRCSSSTHLSLTAKMEDSIAKLKDFSKLDFQSKGINMGGQCKAKMYASNDGTEDNSIDYSHSKPNCSEHFWNLKNRFVFGRTA